MGLYNIIHWDWTILRALSPHYWILFLVHEGQDGWRLLGSIVLCITGARLHVPGQAAAEAAFTLGLFPPYLALHSRRIRPLLA